jgi:CheY-like chemotaxis protein
LTRQLLTFAKGGLPVKKRTAMAPLVREAAGFAALGGNVRCQFDLPDGLWPCDVDPGQIAQVIHNVVLNAIQAMPGGGIIDIAAANARIGTGAKASLPPGDYLRITIRDQGAGIPADLLTKIFTPYYTTKPRGTGLGLATCFAILRKHAGLIEASSEPGVGSTFTLLLPAVAEASAIEGDAGAVLVRGSGRILVMDDEEIIRDTAVAMLETLGYRAVPTRDGAEAVALYREAAGGAAPFTGVVLDLTVPGGMGGREAMVQLRAFDPQVRALVSSGYSENAAMADHVRAGFRGVLHKPYTIEQLSRALEDLAGPGATDGGSRS